MKRCDHDKVYSGQINLSQKFAWVCRKCGQHDWSDDYAIEQVNLPEYHHLRVLHGWAGPRPHPRLPPPPRVPTNLEPPKSDALLVAGVVFFTMLAACCALSIIPWGTLGPVLPLPIALMATGLALGTATCLYVIWKRGSNG
jgi:hypothetical protein